MIQSSKIVYQMEVQSSHSSVNVIVQFLIIVCALIYCTLFFIIGCLRPSQVLLTLADIFNAHHLDHLQTKHFHQPTGNGNTGTFLMLLDKRVTPLFLIQFLHLSGHSHYLLGFTLLQIDTLLAQHRHHFTRQCTFCMYLNRLFMDTCVVQITRDGIHICSTVMTTGATQALTHIFIGLNSNREVQYTYICLSG